jgi:hypothetical protein
MNAENASLAIDSVKYTKETLNGFPESLSCVIF